MSNHTGHLKGGIAAFGIMLSSIIALALLFDTSPIAFTCTQHSILIQLPTIVTTLEHALHLCIPPFIGSINYCLEHSWPWLITITEWFLFSLSGAMFPDIDIKSRSQKYLYAIILIALLVFIGKKEFKAIAALSVVSLLPIFANHRGLFHRLWFIIALPLGVWCWLSVLYPTSSLPFFYCTLFFIAGAISHLWLDMGFKKMLRPRF